MIIGTALKNELNQTVGAVPVILIECFFTTGPRRFAMWQHNIVYNTVTYFGLGQLQEVEPPVADQGTVLTEQFLRFFVQNDPDLLADLQQNSRHGFSNGYLVCLDADGQRSTARRSRSGIGGWSQAAASAMLGTYGADIALESRFHRNKNRAPRTYSHSTQLKRDATDQSFKDSGRSFSLSRQDWRQKSGLA